MGLAEVWAKLNKIFQAVSKAAVDVDAKLTTSQNIRLDKGGSNIEYSNGILEMDNDLKCAWQAMSELEQKCAL